MRTSLSTLWPSLARQCAIALLALAGLNGAHAQTVLADQPLDVPTAVPGNVLLSLSVEYPTATSIAYHVTYNPATPYIGYFDPMKCYNYIFDPATVVMSGGTDAYLQNTDTPANGYNGNYFAPVASPIGTVNSNGVIVPPTNCAGYWSGNFLNWATMQTIDPFRWTLTGGYRIVDTTSMTVLEKAWASGQGGASETPNNSVQNSGPYPVAASAITPFPSTGAGSWGSVQIRLWGLGNRLELNGGGTGFNGTNQDTSDTPFTSGTATKANNVIYSVKVRVQACVPGLLESNCTQYSGDAKPEGLIQLYNQKIRFGVMGYLDDSSIYRDAGVLRAPMGFVGPAIPSLTGGAATTNPAAEWSPTTGIYVVNPDTVDAAATVGPCQNSSGVTVTCVSNSGVIAYLNGFGETAKIYKTYDPVSELYYASQRYFRGLPNVPQWSSVTTDPFGGALSPQTAYLMVDGFPVITNWVNPIIYACQQNFILGIGDVNTHASSNVSGPPAVDNAQWNPGAFPVTSMPQRGGGNEPPIPALVASDTSVDAVGATNFVGNAENKSNTNFNQGGLGSINLGEVNVPWCCGDDATFLMAGLAYDVHVNDMQPTNFLANNINPMNGAKVQIQTVTTYWFDVEEYQQYHYENQFWLAAKYGGFPVKTGYTPYVLPPATPSTSSLSDLGGWATGQNAAITGTCSASTTPPCYGDSLQYGGAGYAMPNNYFGAGNAEAMYTGLVTAFANIVTSLSETTTPFGVSSPNLTTSGSASYASSYNSQYWSGNLIASATTFDAQGNPSSTPVWAVSGTSGTNGFTDLYDSQLGPYVSGGVTYYGWNISGAPTAAAGTHNVATWNGSNGVPFRIGNGTTTGLAVGSAQLASFAQVTGIATVNQSIPNYLNYLRGDHSNESPSGAGYRPRTYLLGDIVDSKANAVGPPAEPYSSSLDPGYSAYVTAQASRPVIVYVGANDGMLHAFNGNVTINPPGGSPPGGLELFAYVPSFLFNGPTATPSVNGLASLGTPNFTHHMMVDSTPGAFDIDLNRTGGPVNGSSPSNWRTLLIGGLGKGGMGYYALDITNPLTLTNEASLAAAVKWEFTQPTMGYSYGLPIVVQTAKYGWVVVLTSGYDNSTGHGYFYFVNPSTGALLETVQTPDAGTPTVPSGLAQVSAFGFTLSGVADSLYAGDLLGNVWRVDLTITSGAYQATQIFVASDSAGNLQPITTQIQVAADPSTSRRYLLFGTGELLGAPDYTTTNTQSFYAVIDGTSAAFSTDPPIVYPMTRATLVDNTNILAGVTLTAGQPNGWYLDFPIGTNPANGAPVAYRENVAAAAAEGTVLFAANLPEGDVCNPTGTNVLYAAAFGSGKSVLLDSNNNLLSTEVVPGGMINELAIIEVQQANGTPGNLEGIAGTYHGNAPAIKLSNTAGGTFQRLNWREVPSAD